MVALHQADLQRRNRSRGDVRACWHGGPSGPPFHL